MLLNFLISVGTGIIANKFSEYGDKSKEETEIYQLVQQTLEDNNSQLEKISADFTEYLRQTLRNAKDQDFTIRIDRLINSLEEKGLITKLIDCALLGNKYSHIESDVAKEIDGIFNLNENIFFDIKPADFIHKLFTLIEEIIPALNQDKWLKSQFDILKRQLQKPKFQLLLPPVRKLTLGQNLTWDLLRYDTELTKFYGREKENVFLNSFLHDDAPLKWTIIYGRGGMGKSRLALQLCRKNKDWHSGFLNKNFTNIRNDINSSSFDVNNLIIIDYAANRIEQVQELLETFDQRQKEGRIKIKIRLVLIERVWNQEIPWYKNYKNSIGALLANTKFTIDEKFCELLPMQSDDLWSAMNDIFIIKQVQVNDDIKQKCLSQLEHIEKENSRILMAMLLANTISENNQFNYKSDEMLLEDFFDREEKNVWTDLGYNANVEQLICLATLCDGIPLKELRLSRKDSPDLHDFVKSFIKADIVQTVSTILEQNSTGTIQPLAPDLLGEYFILRYFRKQTGPLGMEDKCLTLIQLAMTISPNCISVLLRLGQDFFEKNPIIDEADSIEEHIAKHKPLLIDWVDYKCAMNYYELAEKKLCPYKFYARWKLLESKYAGIPEIDSILAKSLVYGGAAPRNDDGSLAIGMRAILLTILTEFINGKEDNPIVSRYFALGVINQMKRFTSPNGKIYTEAPDNYQKLIELTKRHPDDEVIALIQAKIAFHLICNYESDIADDNVWKIYEELSELTKKNRQNIKIAQIQANTIYNLNVAPDSYKKPKRIELIYSDIIKLIELHPTDSKITLRQAQVTHCLFDIYTKNNLLSTIQQRSKAYELYKTSITLSVNYLTNKGITTPLINAATILLNKYFMERELPEVKVLCDLLSKLDPLNKNNEGIALVQANIFNDLALAYIEKNDYQGLKESYIQILSLVTIHPKDVKILEVFSQVSFNLLSNMGKNNELKDMKKIYADLIRLTKFHTLDKYILSTLAHSLYLLSFYYGKARKFPRARHYHEELTALFQLHQTNELVGASLASSAANLIIINGYQFELPWVADARDQVLTLLKEYPENEEIQTAYARIQDKLK